MSISSYPLVSYPEYQLQCSEKSLELFDHAIDIPGMLQPRSHNLGTFAFKTFTLYPAWYFVYNILKMLGNIFSLISELFTTRDSAVLKYRAIRLIVLDPLSLLTETSYAFLSVGASFVGIISPQWGAKTCKMAEQLNYNVLDLRLKIWESYEGKNKNAPIEENIPIASRIEKIDPEGFLHYSAFLNRNTLYSAVISDNAKQHFEKFTELAEERVPPIYFDSIFKNFQANTSFSESQVRKVLENCKPFLYKKEEKEYVSPEIEKCIKKLKSALDASLGPYGNVRVKCPFV